MNIKLKLPQDFLNEETRCGYLVSHDMKKLWAVLLDLLVEFMRVCDENHIKYYMCGGTILGAARHHGMIPWDDDIDVMMFREEYDKLCKIGPKAFKHPYFFQTEETDRGSCRGHIQIRNSETTGILKGENDRKITINQGIFLDVFPLDNMPIRFAHQYHHIENLRKLHSMAYYWRYKYCFNTLPFKFTKSFPINMARYFKSWWSMKKEGLNYDAIYESFLKECTKYNDNDTPFVALTPYPIENGIWSKDFFSDTVYLPFEFIKVPLPSCYERILEIIYGNWKKYVIGASLHGDMIIDTENSYKKYL